MEIYIYRKKKTDPGGRLFSYDRDLSRQGIQDRESIVR